jgi:hypothetical protein
MDTSSLNLSLGGAASPGAITSMAQVTGAIRGMLAAAEISHSTTSGYAAALNATYANLQSGTAISASVDPMFLKNSSIVVDFPGLSIAVSAYGLDVGAALPGAGQFVQFSGLRPGQIPSISMAAAIVDRKNQVASLAARFSASSAQPVTDGVQLAENPVRTTYPLATERNVPLFPRTSTGGAVAQAEAIVQDKAKFLVQGVVTASGKPGFWSRAVTTISAAVSPAINQTVGQSFADTNGSGGWSEPASPYAAQYPYNKATQTESGHLWELDDTPGAERIHIFHRSGSFIEFHPDGTVVYKNMRDGYMLTMANQNVKVVGQCNIFVGGNTTLYSKGDVDIQTDGEFNVQCKKDFNVFAQNINLRAKQTFKGDGSTIDLRYINLPSQIIPVIGGLAPKVNLAALAADFPTGNFADVVQESLAHPLDQTSLASKLQFKSDAEVSAGETVPPALPQNPLSNPAAYAIATPAAAAYRARFFDTPEECTNFSLYASHIGLQQVLGDISITHDPRQLSGKLTSVVTTRNINAVASIDFLDFKNFAGQFNYTASQQVGGTSFAYGALVDTVIVPDVVSTRATPADAAVALGATPVAIALTADTSTPAGQGVVGSNGTSAAVSIVPEEVPAPIDTTTVSTTTPTPAANAEPVVIPTTPVPVTVPIDAGPVTVPSRGQVTRDRDPLVHIQKD